MVEVVVERWRGLDGQVTFRWSVWADGRRLHMGGPEADAATAEAEALEFCGDRFARAPDRVTHL